MSLDASALASDPTVSVWVAANAGSGKTYTLANRVARLLLADASPEKILCLTFTKAAAAEMQDRLFRQLGEWAMLDDAALRTAIAGIGGGDQPDLAKARRLFAKALETPGGLKVLTLHAFCQVVLSRFPLEAGIPPAFDVLDEQTAREMIAEARQRVLERAGSGDAALRAAVETLVVGAGEFRLSHILDAALGSDRRKLERLLASGEDVALLARRAHGLKDGESFQSVTDDFCAALQHDIAQLKAAQEWLASGIATDMKYAGFIARALSAEAGQAQFAALYALFFDSKGEPRTKLATARSQKSNSDLLAWLETLQQHYCAAHERRLAARAAALTEAALTLIAAVRQAYIAAKLLAGVLDYDDLILETRRLLERSGAAQWVLYKLDNGIDHVLVDEAQDTSPEQWAIIGKLTEEFFDERKAGRTLFVVGDEKQSIFSFQGADPAQFAINQRLFAARLEEAGQQLRLEPLITSRRSAPPVLEFVDKVFETEAARAGLTYSGETIHHVAHRATAKGGIEFWPALRPRESEEIDPWLPVDAVQAESPVARLAREVAERIAGWIKSGARLPDHQEPLRPRDIMILLPRREPFGSEVIRQLKRRQIPVAGADRIRLTEQIAVMDLIALGRFVLQQEDDLTLAALLRSPFCGLDEEALFQLAHGRQAGLWAALTAARSRPGFASAHAFLSDMLSRADYAPPFEFYSHALTRLGGQKRLLARLGPESADAIAEFLSLSMAHERNHSPSLEGFLDWVSQGGTEIKRDMERGRDEVRVMTVHGAKGLEADIVILPDTAGQAGGLHHHEGLLFTSDGAFFPLPKEQAPRAVQSAKDAADAEVLREHRRLLYVALTRARDRLYVCGFAGTRKIGEQSWYGLTEAAAKSLGVPVAYGDGEILTHGAVEMETGGIEGAPRTPDALPAWVQDTAPMEPRRPRLIRPSDALDLSASISPLAAQRFRRGLVVHALLARLPEVAPQDRSRIALAFAAAKGVPEPDALVAETLAVLDNPDFAAAFGPNSRAEAGLLAELPELGEGARINGRIDRLAVTDSEVLILDFKTNRPPPVREEMVSGIYLDQMALYRGGAAKIFPGRRIVCGLLFTDAPLLLRLSDAILDRQWGRLVEQLDPTAVRS
ncbi:MAG: double-strand break repair helicase AddA [Alphaproteobacteria bacterium]|nr:double-strand break repair helicase AddA [Alphaproteobacteria bacterium]